MLLNLLITPAPRSRSEIKVKGHTGTWLQIAVEHLVDGCVMCRVLYSCLYIPLKRFDYIWKQEEVFISITLTQSVALILSVYEFIGNLGEIKGCFASV